MDTKTWQFDFGSATNMQDRAGWHFQTNPERRLWVELHDVEQISQPTELIGVEQDSVKYTLMAPPINSEVTYIQPDTTTLVGTIIVENQQRSAASALLHVRLGGLGNAYTPTGENETGLAQLGTNDAYVLLTNATEASWTVEQDGAGIDLNLNLEPASREEITFVYTYANGRPADAAREATRLAEDALLQHTPGILPEPGLGV